MKDNMVQELLLRALLGQNPTANPKQQVNNYQHQTNMNNMLGLRESLETLLKSLYINNAPNKQNSNIKNVNNSLSAQKPNMANQPKTSTPQVFEQFLCKEPDFFKGREMLFEYLNTSTVDFDVEELLKIAQLTKAIEEEAIKRFCAKNPKYAQFLTNENSKFLNKLESSNSAGVEGTLKSTPFFSAQDIDKMSNDEFLRHKDEIDAQILNLIKNS